MAADAGFSNRHGRITPLHVIIVLLSLLMTLGAWQFTKHQLEARTEIRFQGYRNQVVGLLRERMAKYEDALWSGVAAVESHGGDMSLETWRDFASTLRIDEKYPGINGIGMIHFLSQEELPGYLAARLAERPDFRIYPEHSEDIYMPISFIEPEEVNAKAVGLDVAHERNRRTAALASHETGKATITGPIVLVQDAGSTPGFLFYAPFGLRPGPDTPVASDDTKGAVYAPFVVRRLMEGLLAKELRNVRISITDDGETIYDEHSLDDPQNDPDPLYSETVEVALYGRTWVLDVRTNTGFRDSTTFAQPTLILIGGLIIEALIISMLIMMARANQRAIAYAGKVTSSLKEKSDELVTTNQGLERAQSELEARNQLLGEQKFQIEEDHEKLKTAWAESEELRREQSEFTYAVSHDLKSPANTLQLVLNELAMEQDGKLDADSQEFLDLARTTTSRMSELIEDILSYSWATNADTEFEVIDMEACVQGVLSDLAYDIEKTGARIHVGSMDPVFGSRTQLRMLVQNLISNGIKFQDKDAVPEIRIDCSRAEDSNGVVLSVKDNGIGVAPEYTSESSDCSRGFMFARPMPGPALV